MITYIHENKTDIKLIWGIVLKKAELESKCVIGVVGRIFDMWCGSSFKRHSRKNATKKQKILMNIDVTYRLVITEYIIEPTNKYSMFVEDNRLFFQSVEDSIQHFENDSDDECL